MRDWELLYERPPLKRDVALFVLAMILHTPLFFMRFQHAPKSFSNEPRTVKVELLENLNTQIAATPWALPKGPGASTTAQANAVRLKELRKRIEKSRSQAPLPTVPSSVPRPSRDGLKTSSSEAAPASAPAPRLENRGAFTPVPGLGTRGPAGLKGAAASGAAPTGLAPTVREGETASAPLQGKGSFVVGRNQIGAIGGGPGLKTGSSAGAPAPLALRTGETPRADPSALSSAPLLGKGSFGGVGGGTSAPRLKESAAAPAPRPTSLKTPKEEPETAAAPAPLPSYQITGPLKGRKILYQVNPVYPSALRARGVESSVRLSFSVAKDGQVKEVSVVQSSGYREMDVAAVAALRRWTFAPLLRAEEQEGTILMVFSLR